MICLPRQAQDNDENAPLKQEELLVQHNISDLCGADELDAIDANFAKLAAKGALLKAIYIHNELFKPRQARDKHRENSKKRTHKQPTRVHFSFL